MQSQCGLLTLRPKTMRIVMTFQNIPLSSSPPRRSTLEWDIEQFTITIITLRRQSLSSNQQQGKLSDRSSSQKTVITTMTTNSQCSPSIHPRRMFGSSSALIKTGFLTQLGFTALQMAILRLTISIQTSITISTTTIDPPCSLWMTILLSSLHIIRIMGVIWDKIHGSWRLTKLRTRGTMTITIVTITMTATT